MRTWLIVALSACSYFQKTKSIFSIPASGHILCKNHLGHPLHRMVYFFRHYFLYFFTYFILIDTQESPSYNHVLIHIFKGSLLALKKNTVGCLLPRLTTVFKEWSIESPSKFKSIRVYLQLTLKYHMKN